jgi:hypothetical protein
MTAVAILGKPFDFIAWKERFQSFYVRRSDGELRVIELRGLRKPIWHRSLFDSDPVEISESSSKDPFFLHRLWCEFADGNSASLTGCTSSAPTLLEMEQLRKLLRTRSVSGRSQFSNEIRTMAVEAYGKQLAQHPKSKLRAASLAAEAVGQKTGKTPDPKTIQNWYAHRLDWRRHS